MNITIQLNVFPIVFLSEVINRVNTGVFVAIC